MAECDICLGPTSGYLMCKACGRSYDRYAHDDASIHAALVWAARRARRTQAARVRAKERRIRAEERRIRAEERGKIRRRVLAALRPVWGTELADAVFKCTTGDGDS
jgi:hypothetical protein